MSELAALALVVLLTRPRLKRSGNTVGITFNLTPNRTVLLVIGATAQVIR